MYSADLPEEFTVGGASLSFRRGSSSWEITAERIVCVGEATSDTAANGEDWLLCLITDTQGSWLEASLYAHGRNDALQWLSLALGTSLEVKLANAPPFRSRVMWPAQLKESPLFEYQVSLFRRAFGRSLRRLGLAPRDTVQTVHPAVLDSLWRTRRQTKSRSV